MSDSRPIGVFDSGVGGLTVVHELFRQCPDESVVYFGDTARVPYGTKSAKSVQRFAKQDAAFLLQHDVKIIVVACHTASATALDVLKQQFRLPILGVTEPGVEAALQKSANGRIGVIGTRGTIHSRAYNRYLQNRRPGAHIVTQPCPLFVPLAEEGWLDTEVTRQVAEIYLSPMTEAGVDTLILGCTHYPLLKGIIGQVMGNRVTLVDSAEETVKVVRRLLQENRMLCTDRSGTGHRFFCK